MFINLLGQYMYQDDACNWSYHKKRAFHISISLIVKEYLHHIYLPGQL